MSYKDHFTRYGHPSEEWEVRLYDYLRRPDVLKTSKDIAYYDGSAAETIRAAQALIDNLTEYRQALAARYAQLETMLYTDLLKLERVPHWDGKKYYYVTITRRFEDGTEQEQLRENFTGKERREAFKRFEELKKKYPGIKTEQDTARRAWEH